MKNIGLIVTLVVVSTLALVRPLLMDAVFGQEMPNIAATEAIYDIYRIPPMTDALTITDTPLLPSVTIYIDANGHMVAKDETGLVVDFTALALNCEIMARDFNGMATMLFKIGEITRKGEGNSDE